MTAAVTPISAARSIGLVTTPTQTQQWEQAAADDLPTDLLVVVAETSDYMQPETEQALLAVLLPHLSVDQRATVVLEIVDWLEQAAHVGQCSDAFDVADALGVDVGSLRNWTDVRDGEVDGLRRSARVTAQFAVERNRKARP